MWDLWWTKSHWGRFSPSTAVFPANHFTDYHALALWLKRYATNRKVAGFLNLPNPSGRTRPCGLLSI
jgi:hypothetical protein